MEIKLKKKEEEEHLREISDVLQKNQENIDKGSKERIYRSSSLPLTDRRESSLNNDSNPGAEKFNKTNDWWTRSNWAFLNEPPVTAMDGPSYKYASQYNITDFGNSTVQNSNIST